MSIHRDPKSGFWRVSFRFAGKQYQKSLKTTDEKQAEEEEGRIKGTLRAIEQGYLTVPADADFWQFVHSGGKLEARPKLADALTLEELFDRYEKEMPPGTMEENSLDTFRLHRSHLLRLLGGPKPASAVTTTDMQGYVNKRAKEAYRGKAIKSQTIKKEVGTFRAVWNWGMHHGLVAGPAPTRGLKYEKGDEKPPFMTWAEVERRVARGGLTEMEVGELWDCLFLDRKQIDELLVHVKEHAAYPFVYPMFVFVAHTSARRSEMMQSRVEDLDFKAGEVVLREKKKDRSVKVTFRRVPMSPLFAEVLRDWVEDQHPGGPFIFCQLSSRMKRREKPEPLTKNVARCHFSQTLSRGKWQVVRGFHVFRHSFASNLAAEGIDQRIIDEWMGHQTEEMRKRYRHLFPHKTREAFLRVYG